MVGNTRAVDPMEATGEMNLRQNGRGTPIWLIIVLLVLSSLLNLHQSRFSLWKTENPIDDRTNLTHFMRMRAKNESESLEIKSDPQYLEPTNRKSEPQIQTPEPTKTNASERLGVILWSEGRSATGSLADTVVFQARWKFCNRNKEGFKPPWIGCHKPQLQCLKGQKYYYYRYEISPTVLDRTALKLCMKKKELFLHVKPWHVTGTWYDGRVFRGKRQIPEGIEMAAEDIEPIKSADSFFAAAASAGFGTVIVSVRENVLARMVSFFEEQYNHVENVTKGLKGTFAEEAETFFMEGPRKAKRKRWPHFGDTMSDGALVSKMAAELRLFAEGVRAAEESGFNIIKFMFEEVTKDLCRSSNRFFAELGREIESQNDCVPEVTHRGVLKNKTEKTLTDRVGLTVATNWKAQLSGTKHEWMLGLSNFEGTEKDFLESWREDCPLLVEVMTKYI